MILVLDAPPPNFLVAARGGVLRRSIVISGWVPLRSELREQRR